jgi:formiminotetrahydrofolate cyclodeaminase
MPDDLKPYSEFALIDLLDAYASNAPVPGGGSAAALAGALGVSLLVMAASLPKSRTGAPEEAADLAEAAARLRPLRDVLVQLIDADSDAYRAVMAAMKLPKTSDAEKASRTAALQSALKAATDVPLDVMRAGQQALTGAVIVARNVYRVAASDVATGIELIGSSVRSAALSIDGNLAAIKDDSYTARVSAEREQLASDSARDGAFALEILTGLRPSLRP